MTIERGDDEDSRELRLEGVGLIVVGGVLIAAVAGAFVMGRWVERRSQTSQALEALGPSPLSQVVERAEIDESSAEADFFDQAQGTDKELEPSREAREETPPPPPRQRPQPANQPAAAAVDPGGIGDYFVQVFAGRDRSSAESLVGKLQTEGYEVRVLSEREGQGLLFKVRVGGYPSKDRAQRIAQSLKQSGYSAWVPPLE